VLAVEREHDELALQLRRGVSGAGHLPSLSTRTENYSFAASFSSA
jgi:hypothetical protein